jgi:hypothetical protein
MSVTSTERAVPARRRWPGLLVLPALAVAGLLAFRVSKDIHKKLQFANTYAIQSVGTGKNVRVRDAGIGDGTPIILYRHANWECMTWRLIQLEDASFLLQNLYTQKPFQPSSSPEPGVKLWQQVLGGSRFQRWELILEPGDTYLIRLQGTELYATASSDENDSPIVLMPRQNSPGQLWRLVRQTPVV